MSVAPKGLSRDARPDTEDGAGYKSHSQVEAQKLGYWLQHFEAGVAVMRRRQNVSKRVEALPLYEGESTGWVAAYAYACARLESGDEHDDA